MKKTNHFLLVAMCSFIFSEANAVNLKSLYSIPEPRLQGVWESFLDMDSVKEVGAGIFDIETIQNVPPLIDQEGSIIKSPNRSEKMYITINCKSKKAKRKFIEEFSQLNAKGSLVNKTDLTKSKNDGFVMTPKTSEYLAAQIVCKKS